MLALIKRKALLSGLFRLGEAKFLSLTLHISLYLSLALTVAILLFNAVLAVVKWHMLTKIFIYNLFLSVPTNLLSSAKASKWTNIFRLQFSSTLFTALKISCASFF